MNEWHQGFPVAFVFKSIIYIQNENLLFIRSPNVPLRRLATDFIPAPNLFTEVCVGLRAFKGTQYAVGLDFEKVLCL